MNSIDNVSNPVPVTPGLEDFLRPLHIDVTKAHALAHELHQTFQQLAAESLTQFLPTPISESILRPSMGRKKGRGGSNLRVGFIELLGNDNISALNGGPTNGKQSGYRTSSNIRRVLEKSWPIQDHLKNENADFLFAWIGSCIAEVVREGVEMFHLKRNSELPMGVAFSFPIVQNTLSDATIMAMGKGFAINSKLDLGTLLVNGYEKSRSSDLPPIRVAAILNDAVATLVSFIYQFQEDNSHKAAMGFICGTGTNATIPLQKSALNPQKLPRKIKVTAKDEVDDMKITVNTEWSINGSAEALRKLGLINKWDTKLDAEGEAPGFQPFEYMTSGRYLGELARLMFVDYMTAHLSVPEESLPPQLARRFGLTTTFLSHYQPPHPPTLVRKLEVEFPPNNSELPVKWTEESAVALYHIVKSIEIRASGLVAAAIVGLLACADDIPLSNPLRIKTNQQSTNGVAAKMNLVVGYTGGCIWFLDSIISAEFGDHAPVRVVLSPCHDGGIIGAGVLCGASQAESKDNIWKRINIMAHNEQQPDGVHDHEDQPDEHTALLQNANRARGNDSWAEDSPANLAPGPLKPVLQECIPGDLDVEANSDSSGGSDAATVDDDDDDDDNKPSTFLVDTHPRRFHVVFAGIMLTYFIANFDSTIMASSHPVITSYFHSSNSASWLTTAFLLTSTAFQPLVGRLSDTTGRRPLYLATMAVFAAATAWCALAGSMASFIAARAVCGLGAGGMMTLGAISISDCVPIERRGTFQSYINIVYGLAAASGAAFGGTLADTLGWRWEFGVQVFPVLLCLATAFFSMPADLGKQKKKETLAQAMRAFDFKGSALLTLSTTFLILGLNLGGNILPWSHPFIIASLVTFGVCFPTCLYVESHAERPIMPLVLLHSTPRANIIFSNFLASFLVDAILFNAPLFFQAVLLKSATQSGLYLVVPVAAASLTGTATGVLISRTRRLRWPLLLGTVCFLAGTALLATMRRGWPTWAYLLCLVPAAAGQGFQFPGTFIAVLAASAQRDQAVVTSTLQLWRALGRVLGVACSSLVFQNALLGYLVAFVTPSPPDGDGRGGGEEWKREFIERVRSSVEAVAKLSDGRAKDQVIMSYEAACRVTFLVCLGVAAVSVLLILPTKLPRLGKK
ncbi:MFS general substrate transporter [Xylariaceae sp. FL1651]|nr:MFS general substrate transporter [Xylariaceae sp. FL1651]